ncbi:MAG: xanthine dehydrogenase accessory protein XdhC [Rhodocyclales bacterium]|nr:xanthine dehydrogenase accessory protein XdhC [Rhodocyclales bacterium]
MIRRFPLGASLGQCCGGVVNLLFEVVTADAAWFDPLRDAVRARRGAVLVTAVHGAAGSGKLLVSVDGHSGGLGDDGLDAIALQRARELLASGGKPALVDAGGELQGRPAVLYFEPLPVADFHVVLFGAGHVGRALVQVLAPLAERITWVDPRADEFPAVLPPNVDKVVSEFAEDEVETAPAGAWFVVMTHSHALDQRLTEHILRRGDFAWFGLIGSCTKRRAFERRLQARGVAAACFERMTCPIGAPGIRDKHPAAIAVAVAAQMLQQREAAVALRSVRQA